MKTFIVITTADIGSKDIQDFIWMNVDGEFALTVSEVEGSELDQPTDGMPHPFANPEGVYPTSPVYDFFTAPEEVRRPIVEEAIKQASEEQGKITSVTGE